MGVSKVAVTDYGDVVYTTDLDLEVLVGIVEVANGVGPAANCARKLVGPRDGYIYLPWQSRRQVGGEGEGDARLKNGAGPNGQRHDEGVYFFVAN